MSIAVPVISAKSNARWIGAIQVFRVAVQLVGLLLLSRLLSPEDFGLVAMVSIVTNLAGLLRDMGTAAAVIQKQTLENEIILTAFWLNCIIGVALGMGIAGLSGLLAAIFHAPALVGLLLLVAVAFPITGSGTVHQALLERASRFSVIARVEIIAALCGLGVALIAAYAGAGAYSLVLQTLAVAVLSTVQLWFASGWRPRWYWSTARLRELSGFSSNLFAFNIVNYFSRNADNMVVGRWLGASSLGAYSLAYRIMLFPLQNLTVVATRALFPVFSRQQTAPGEMAGLYLRTLSVIAFFTAPLMAGLFVLRVPFVHVFLGEKWSSVAGLIAWLAPVGFIQSLVSTTGTVFMAGGRTDTLFRLGVLGAVLQVSSFLIGVHWGVTGVAAGYFIANLLNALPAFYFTFRLLDQSAWQLVGAIYRPAAIALLMALAVQAGLYTLGTLALPAIAQLIILSGIGALLYFGAAHFGARPVERDVLRLFMSKA